MSIDFASIVAVTLLVAVMLLAWVRRADPEGGQALMRAHADLNNRVATLEEKMTSCATKADVQVAIGKIDALEAHAASSGEVIALEGKLNVVASKVDGIEQSVDRVEGGVRRIESFFIERGIGK